MKIEIWDDVNIFKKKNNVNSKIVELECSGDNAFVRTSDMVNAIKKMSKEERKKLYLRKRINGKKVDNIKTSIYDDIGKRYVCQFCEKIVNAYTEDDKFYECNRCGNEVKEVIKIIPIRDKESERYIRD